MSERQLRKRRALTDISNNGSNKPEEVMVRPVNDDAPTSTKGKRAKTSTTLPDPIIVVLPTTSAPEAAIVQPVLAAPASTTVASASSSSSSSSSSASSSSSSATASSAPVVAPVRLTPPAEADRAVVPRKCHYKKSKNPDPAQCLDFIDSMYSYYYSQEDVYSAKPYMSRHDDINTKMRSILVDWLVEVHYKFKLQHPTLWLCVNILDRYLSLVVISRAKLQLVGVCALFIACKFEEIYPPEIKDCVHITDLAYKKEDVVKMEAAILQALDYQVFVPTGHHFLVRYLDAAQASTRIRHLAYYYAERYLQEIESLEQLPHKLAAAAVYAAFVQQAEQFPHLLRNSPSWSATMVAESGLTEAELVPLAKALIQKVSEEQETASRRRLIAAKKKYLQEKFLGVSSLPLPTF